MAALAVNQLAITDHQLKCMMEWFASRERVPGAPRNAIFEHDFIRAMYALSIQSREVDPPNQYAVFPDSDFRAEAASQAFKWKRWMWTVCLHPCCGDFTSTG